MSALAGFVMKGPMQGALVAACCLVLGALFPPFLWLSSAAIGLVWLRSENRDRLITTVVALVGAGVFFTLVSGSTLASVILASMFWLPVIVLALVLRRTVSLALCVLVAAGLGALMVLGIFAFVDNPPDLWRSHLTQLFPSQVQQQSPLPAESWTALIDVLAQVMTGSMAAWFSLSALFGLFIARRWQAQLYNPEGFQREFHSLRLGRSATLALAAVLLGIFTDSALLFSLAMVAGVVCVVQGLAVVHAVVNIKQLGRFWLIGTYFLLMFLLVQMSLLLATIGVADAWVDFRTRVARQTSN